MMLIETDGFFFLQRGGHTTHRTQPSHRSQPKAFYLKEPKNKNTKVDGPEKNKTKVEL